MSEADRDLREGDPSSRRVRVVEPVRTRFPRFGDFVTQYSENVSVSGMFLRSDDPQPVGTRFDFEFSVSNESPMMRGTGEVVWIRREAEAEDRPAGMGVRFIELDPKSRRVIRWLMESLAREGKEPFDLGDGEHGERREARKPSSGVGSRRTAAPPDVAQVRSASSMRNRRLRQKRRLRADLAALAVIALIALVWWLARSWSAWFVAGEEPKPDRESVSTAVRSEIPPDIPEAAGAADEVRVEEILSEVRAWARAWTERDADGYLAHYGESFEPPRGRSRREWEAWRRERLAEPDFIRVALTGFEVESLETDRATVSFFQSYRSDLRDETVRKRLVLAREGDSWKIVEERVEG